MLIGAESLGIGPLGLGSFGNGTESEFGQEIHRISTGLRVPS